MKCSPSPVVRGIQFFSHRGGMPEGKTRQSAKIIADQASA